MADPRKEQKQDEENNPSRKQREDQNNPMNPDKEKKEDFNKNREQQK